MIRKSALYKWLSLTGVLTVASSALAATPANTPITNQATANYSPVTPGGVTQSVSNTVTTTVQAQCSVSLTEGENKSILGGDPLAFAYTLTNTGNATANFPVSVTSNDFDSAPELTIYLDSNGNGKLDAGDTPVGSSGSSSNGSIMDLPANSTVKLLVKVTTTTSTVTPKDGYGVVNLTTSCAGGESPATGTNQVVINPPPTLNVQKSFTPAEFTPGATTTVHITTTNNTKDDSRVVVLTDLLAEQRALGLEFVPDSVKTYMGTIDSTTTNVGKIEYTSMDAIVPSDWSTTAPAIVQGIRVTVDNGLKAGEVLNLTFKMKATEAADGKQITNTALALTGNATTSGKATANVHYNPAVAIGPKDIPEATEGTAEDSQTKAFAVLNDQVCFDHTLKNTGDVEDTFSITVALNPGVANVAIKDASGNPFQPVHLGVGEQTEVMVCYTPTKTGPLTSVVTTTGSRKTNNYTTDIISDIQDGKPALFKSYKATYKNDNGDIVTREQGGNVAVGDTVVYTLKVTNPYKRDLNNVVITDPLPAHLTYTPLLDEVIGDVVIVNGHQEVSWNVGTLGAGQSKTFTVTTTVNDVAVDGEFLNNIFNMTSTEFPVKLDSNEVKVPVWNAELKIIKDVTPKIVTYGDKVTYTLKITNPSKNTAIENAIVADTPAKGLEYIASTSTLESNPLVDPTISDGVMRWNVGTLPAGGTITVTYQMRVTPEVQANADLVNVVEVRGIAANVSKTYIASNVSRASIKLDPLKFAPLADLVGTVFVDRNRNGLYEPGLDTPVDRARVILAGGRLSLTDTKGRYHFSNVPYGSWALRLDPNTTPYPPLKLPQDSGFGGSRLAWVRGLTSVDFPLAPLGGDITALRRTSLTVGDVNVDKAVYAVPGGYVVTLKIKSPRALNGFHLEDPLPGGAVLKEGRNTLDGTLDAGETNLTYHFDWTGEPLGATTDPLVSWRY